MREQCPAETLGVVVLQDIKDLLGYTYARGATSAGVPEVDQQRQTLLPRRVEVNCALQHVDQVFHALRCLLGVLVLRQQVQARPSLVVEAEKNLLASRVFFRYVFCGEAVGAVFATPY
jgi:hypothetical protein